MERPMCRSKFSAHAIAGVKHDSDGDGCVLTGKMSDLLFHAILEDMKLALIHSWNWYAKPVCDIDVHQNQRNIHSQIDVQFGRALRSYGQRNNGESGNSDPKGIHEATQQEEYSTSAMRLRLNYRCSTY